MPSFRTRATVATTTALLAALALTACQNDDQGTDPGAPAASAGEQNGGTTTGAANAPSAPSATGDSTDGNGARNSSTGGSSTGSGSGSGSGSGAVSSSGTNAPKGSEDSSAGACSGANSKVTVTTASRPINHLLLTVTNTGSTACDAYSAPLLGFDGDQSVTRIIEDSKPQSVRTLAPGESAYAGITLTGEPGGDTHGGIVKKLRVNFAGRDGGSTGSPVTLTLPKDTFKDDNAAVTYWQSSVSDALEY
ncbi:DUF4232 domain-containing protein [Streptomyces sp. LP05-1]|uniref:DUF4232 domain-containing protein n=1 Tax=Streptomyces pyxinae TaxID=2970734 RepID=A0ABT2CN71_9ACTN|nr:DUF4232 domain-containing protein [Streptomyces sp. LP05-1]MCS0638892.1 DUF4232 domain-containing protein [Streptomyces sp. LP05-1]